MLKEKCQFLRAKLKSANEYIDHKTMNKESKITIIGNLLS